MDRHFARILSLQKTQKETRNAKGNSHLAEISKQDTDKETEIYGIILKQIGNKQCAAILNWLRAGFN
jgi:hypothetical protein